MKTLLKVGEYVRVLNQYHPLAPLGVIGRVLTITELHYVINGMDNYLYIDHNSPRLMQLTTEEQIIAMLSEWHSCITRTGLMNQSELGHYVRVIDAWHPNGTHGVTGEIINIIQDYYIIRIPERITLYIKHDSPQLIRLTPEEQLIARLSE